MKNTALFNLIKGFSNDEINGFDKYLLSPYFVRGSSLNKVYKEIIRNKNLFLYSDYEKLIDKLCKKLKYSRLTLNKQLSYLSREIISYLKLKSFENDEISATVSLNEYLFKKKDYSTLKNCLKKADSLLSIVSNINEKSFLHLFRHDVTIFNYIVNDSSIKSKSNKANWVRKLNCAFRDIILYSYIEVTSIVVDFILLDLYKYNQIDKELLLKINKFLSDYNNLKLFDDKSIEKNIFDIYHNMFLTYYYKENKKFFLAYRKSVEQNIKLLSASLKNFHYQALTNFCNMKERLGQEKEFFIKEGLNLLLKYFNNNYFKVDEVEYVNKIEYTNFVGKAYVAKEYEILKSFIETVSSKLKPTEYSNMVNLGYAFYYLGKKEYRKSLKYINSISDNDTFVKFDVRNIELRIYYEMGRIETLIDSIHNYRTTILNNKELTIHDKEGLLKLLKYLNALININNKTNLQEQIYESGYYKKLIENEPFFSLKNWLLEKYDNLISDINARKYSKAKLVNE